MLTITGASLTPVTVKVEVVVLVEPVGTAGEPSSMTTLTPRVVAAPKLVGLSPDAAKVTERIAA